MKKYGLIVVLLLGALLRLIWVEDMEYKLDEAYMYDRVAAVGTTEAWPWLGMPSTVGLRNPGMSVWVFLGLGKIFAVQSPTDLARAVQILNILAIIGVVGAALLLFKNLERELWLWSAALIAVNPFAINYHRKIWAQSVLPFFALAFLLSWRFRGNRTGAFLAGILGLCLGQIHMSGFFYFPAFLIWGWFHRREAPIAWKWIIAGVAIAFLPMIPWVDYVIHYTAPADRPLGYHWNELTQFRYWVLSVTTPLGLHLGNILGIHRGGSALAWLADFIKYPLWNGSPVYLVGFFHLALLGCVGWIGFRWIGIAWESIRRKNRTLTGSGASHPVLSPTTRHFLGAAWIAYGVLLTLPGIVVKRFYTLITFPLGELTIAYAAWKSMPHPKWSRGVLCALVLLQLGVSAGMLIYLHENRGSIHGDYGQAYRESVH